MEALVVDDHPLLQEVLTGALQKAFGRVVVHCASNVEDALEQARKASPLALVLLDLGLRGCTGIESLTRFREKHPGLRIVVISAEEECETVHAALKAGASGYIPKTSKPDTIIAALRHIVAGGIYIPPAVQRMDEEDLLNKLDQIEEQARLTLENPQHLTGERQRMIIALVRHVRAKMQRSRTIALEEFQPNIL